VIAWLKRLRLALRYWYRLNYSWRLAWYAAYRAS